MKHERHNRSIEVELSAGELSELARPIEDEMSRAALHGYMPLPTPQMLQSAQAKKGAHGASSASIQRFFSARAAGILGSVIVAGIAVAAHFEYSESKRVVEPPIAWTPLPERPAEPPVEEVVAEAPPPTLYTNPFDPTEVFELPPGLTKSEARDMVAQILMERARERMQR